MPSIKPHIPPHSTNPTVPQAPPQPPTDDPTTTAPNLEEANTTPIPNAPPNNPNEANRPPSPSQPPSPPKRRKKQKETHFLHQCTYRKTTWSYMHLTLITPGTASLPPPSTTTATTHTKDISPLLVSTLLTHPLSAYLGTTGSAIPFDILKTSGREVWLRVPRQDGRAVQASLSGWIGSVEGDDVPGLQGQGQGQGGRVKVAWRVIGEAGVLGGVCGGGDGSDLFG